MLPSIRVVSTSAGTPIDRELRHGAKMNKRGAETFDLTADVLVVGGGPAAAWAAIAASEAGARVILVDKGYVGTSGATAPANTGTWSPPPGEPRRAAIDARLSRAGGLADPEWIEHTIGMAWDKLHCLADWGYPFPIDDNGEVYRANLRGPDYMHFMRRRALRAGVKIFDHHPALELLGDDESVAGRGRRRPPARPAVAGACRRRRARHRRLRLRRADARGGGADRRRLSDGGGSRRRDVRHGVLGAIRLHAEAERAQQGTAVRLGELLSRGRHADRYRRPGPLYASSPRRCSKGRSSASTTRRGPRCRAGCARASRTAFCRSTAATSIRSPSAGR